MTELSDPIVTHFSGAQCNLCSFVIRVSYQRPDDATSDEEAISIVDALVLAARERHLRELHPIHYRAVMRQRELQALARLNFTADYGAALEGNLVVVDCDHDGCTFRYGLPVGERDVMPRLRDILLGHYAAQHPEIWKGKVMIG